IGSRYQLEHSDFQMRMPASSVRYGGSQLGPRAPLAVPRGGERGGRGVLTRGGVTVRTTGDGASTRCGGASTTDGGDGDDAGTGALLGVPETSTGCPVRWIFANPTIAPTAP